ncbi:MAG: Uma2 family endonuclease [Deltaproteobacteria bacterium]|nr:Uma2 family endonuclease [Deltaproteobacteria bacterium]
MGHEVWAPSAFFPPVDDRLAEPEAGEEVIDGQRVRVMPADEPHGFAHAGLDYLLRGHLEKGYRSAADMLTRTSATNDMAPDVSIYPEARDPLTGGRRLEELAFEIVNTQSMTDVTKRALEFKVRGVRRVFCINVAKGKVLEWDQGLGDWRIKTTRARIRDRCLVRPLSVAALLDTTQQDDEVARALIAKRNVVLQAELDATKRAGIDEGLGEGLEKGEKLGLEKGEKLGLEKGERLGLEKGEKLGLEKGEKLGLEKGEKLGLEKGEKLGLEKGEKLGLEKAIERTCATLGIEFDDAKKRDLTTKSVDDLLSLLVSLQERSG